MVTLGAHDGSTGGHSPRVAPPAVQVREAGVRLLRQLGGFPAAVLSLVGEHHERIDGAGYPAGLAGDELGLGPRILAVCDVYDALVSDRVYREAWSVDRALA